MTPTHFYNGGIHGEQYGDGPWLVETIDLLPIRRQSEIAKRYSEIYLQLMDDDPRNARYRSNTYLRKRVEKICKEFQKNTDNTLPF